MSRTVEDVLWKRAKKKAEREGRGKNIKRIMEIYKKLGGTFKSLPLDSIQLGGTSW